MSSRTPSPATARTPLPEGYDRTGVTPDGAAWLASALARPGAAPHSWAEHPGAPVVLPCGTAFDIVNAPAIFGRRMLDRLWDEGPGSGPVAVHRGRMLLFAAPGTARRLPTLLGWEEWNDHRSPTGTTRAHALPPLLCHGTGDAVTLPAVHATADRPPLASRWLVAPDTRRPWLPGPEVLLWAAVRAARAAQISISPPPNQGAKVYDVSRRR
ncbi:hypothetical protein AB0L85_00520 [Streptomyces sp. NPDC052051]|uniref:hypothetical protein n=1 Tax=Streptomyces sp. NPDC052051 TaxID=3154649 RepID=UPI0034418C90